MRTRKKTGVAVVVLGLALALGIAAPASAAEEYQEANKTTPSATMELCTSTSNAVVGCFKKAGDKIYVNDDWADGMSVYVLWANNLRDSNNNWQAYRNGRCEYFGGWDNWGECAIDIYEHSTSPNAKGGKGSRVRIKACVNVPRLPDECSDWTGYVYNDQ